MEAATPLPLTSTSVRFAGDRLVADGLIVADECAVRLAQEAEDPATLLVDAIEIGARILDREHTAANADFVKAEFERTARELDQNFVERARTITEGLEERLKTHFGDESSEAVQHKVRSVVRDVSEQMHRELREQLFTEREDNPLAKFHRIQLALAKQVAEQHTTELRTVGERLEEMRLEVERLRAENEKLDELEAEREKGTAKGRSFEEAVAEAIESLALPQGDDPEAVGDVKEATGKTGDVVVAIDGCNGPARGRIVFEAKNTKLSRPEALRELDRAREERNADFAVLVVAHEGKVPAKLVPLREYNGDKMVVTYDPEDGSLLSLQVAYALARARVLLRRADGDGLDSEAIRACAERAVQSLGEVQRIKQQLTASKTAVDKAADIVDAMAAAVKTSLAEIEALVAAAAIAEAA